MQNLLLDYCLEPDNIHRPHEALCDLYCGYVERSVRELRPDGFWTSDLVSNQARHHFQPDPAVAGSACKI